MASQKVKACPEVRRVLIMGLNFHDDSFITWQEDDTPVRVSRENQFFFSGHNYTLSDEAIRKGLCFLRVSQFIYDTKPPFFMMTRELHDRIRSIILDRDNGRIIRINGTEILIFEDYEEKSEIYGNMEADSIRASKTPVSVLYDGMRQNSRAAINELLDRGLPLR